MGRAGFASDLACRLRSQSTARRAHPSTRYPVLNDTEGRALSRAACPPAQNTRATASHARHSASGGPCTSSAARRRRFVRRSPTRASPR